MIEVKNVYKEFKKVDNKKKVTKFLADEDISIDVKEGEVVGILGPNGAGKTTLLRMIAGVMTPTKGEIIIDDKNYLKDSVAIKKKLAFLSGNTKLYSDLSCYELLEMFGDYYGVDKEKLEERIKKVTDRFNLKDFINQRIGSLSTGQLQRVNIARCVIHDPKYYIFDEATSGLDIISSKIILDFIKEEKEKGKGIIYSTHYMEEAENICDRVFLIHKGKVLKTDTPNKIVKDTKTTNLRDAFFSIIGGESNE